MATTFNELDNSEIFWSQSVSLISVTEQGWTPTVANTLWYLLEILTHFFESSRSVPIDISFDIL